MYLIKWADVRERVQYNVECYSWLFLPAPILKALTKTANINNKTVNTIEFQRMSAHQERWEISWAKQRTHSMLKSHSGTLELQAHIDHGGDWHWSGVGDLLVECRGQCRRRTCSLSGTLGACFQCSCLSVLICEQRELTEAMPKGTSRCDVLMHKNLIEVLGAPGLIFQHRESQLLLCNSHKLELKTKGKCCVGRDLRCVVSSLLEGLVCKES